jgi:hypothetical protein
VSHLVTYGFVVLVTWAALGRTALGAVVDVIGNLSDSDYSTYIAPQSYRDWGNEPCLAVNPLNPQEMVISTFGYGSWISSPTAQLWYSTNAGAHWAICFAVPTPFLASAYFVDDQTFAYDAAGVLHGAFMAFDGTNTDFVCHGTTTNVNSASAWTWNSSAIAGTNIDQPWICISGGRVAIGYDNFNGPYTFSEERVAISTDNGQTFPPVLDQAVCSLGRVNTGIVNPGLRVAADEVGDFFILCGVRTNNDASGVPLINYRLNRYSVGPNWDFTTATADAIGGIAITNGPSRQGNNSDYSFGHINYLLGNITALAVNTNGSRVYVVYGISDTNQIGRLFLQTLQLSGSNLVKAGDPQAVSSSNFTAALPSVAVARNGTVGVLYDEFDGTNFHVHLALSRDGGSSIAAESELYSFSTNGMVLGYGTTPNHNRLLGDFGRMVANGDTFYATFAGRGNVSAATITTTNYIVPCFFSFDASVAPPSILGMVRVSADAVRIDFAGTPSATYFVEAATNLISPIAWQTVSTNVPPGSGQWSYTDLTTGFAQRYYRAVRP